MTSTSETYEISVAADLDNLSLVLRNEEVRGYPVWVNVTSWNIADMVQLGNQTLIVRRSSDRYGFYCWVAELEDDTNVYYHKELGIFLGFSYYDANWLGGTSWAWTQRDIDVTYQNIDDFYSVEYMLNFDAVLLSAILVESATLIAHADRMRKGLTLRKS